MIINFLCMLWPQWALMVFHSVAVGIVVNGVLRTLGFQR